MNEESVKNEHRSKKGIARRVWLILLLILPTLIAVFSFFMIYNNVYISPKNIYDISLYDFEGELIASEKNYLRNAESNGLVLLFSPITENLNETSSIPDTVDKSEYFKAVVQYMNTRREYYFYFSVDNVVGYCSFDGEGYKLSGSDTSKFLSSRFAESLYKNAVPPVMYSISGEDITPSSVNWSYRTAEGDYSIAQKYTVSDDVVRYDMSGALGVSFSTHPDRCNAVVYIADEKLFEGDVDEMSTLSFEKGTVVHIDINAEWDYATNEQSYGTLSYSFDAEVTDRAEFHLTGDTFAIDAFCGIFCTNVKDASKIVFESEPKLPVSPSFALSHENAVALLPIVPDTVPGEYKVTLSYGATTQSFVLNIKQRAGGITLECALPADKIDSALSDETMNEIEELKSFAFDNSKGEKLFYGEFLNYETLGAELYARLGDIYVNPHKGYLSEGHEYRFGIWGGVRVGALNSGAIIKTGYNEYLGNYVIVSHGCGLATWYAHLSTVDVAVGDYVVRGESVGKTGDTGLSNSENVLILATLGSEFTNPVYLCGQQFD